MPASRHRLAYKAYRRALRVPVRTSRDVIVVRDGVLVRLERADGQVAFGEIVPLERFGTETLVGAIGWCASVAGGITEEQLRAVPRDLPCCTAAIHSALARMNRNDGPSAPEPVPLPVVSLLPTGPEAMRALEPAAEAGFRVFKVKIGAAAFAAESVDVARVVDCLPEGGRLRLDANGALDVSAASRWLDAAAGWPVEFIEQPLAPSAERDLVRLAEDHATPVALDESVRDADDIKRWRDRGWKGVFVIKPATAGNPVELAHEISLDPQPFVFSSALETAIGTVAAVELAFACGITRALGFGVAGFFEQDGLGGGIEAPTINRAELQRWDLEAVWNRL